MPFANYTTTVPVNKTVAEVQAMLGKAGAKQVSVWYDNEQPSGLTFGILVDGSRLVHFQVPADVAAVHWILTSDKQVPKRLKTEAQAARVTWRIIRDWVRAQLAFIEAGQVELEQVFLPYALDNDGRTLYDVFKMSSGDFLLGPGE